LLQLGVNGSDDGQLNNIYGITTHQGQRRRQRGEERGWEGEVDVSPPSPSSSLPHPPTPSLP